MTAESDILAGIFRFNPDEATAHFILHIPAGATLPIEISEHLSWHPPVPRNPLLAEVLVRLRLINRANLGIGRIYRALLIEGKEPPTGL